MGRIRREHSAFSTVPPDPPAQTARLRVVPDRASVLRARIRREHSAFSTVPPDPRARIPRTLSVLLSVLAAFVVALAVLGPELGAEAQRRLRVDIHVTQAQIPQSLTERGLIGFARGHRAARLQESSEENLRERRWHANVVFAFNQPPGDLEFHALFYDVHDGGRNFVREMSVFTADRTQRTVLHRLMLPRPTFRPNRRMEMVVTVRREEVGTLRFELVGEEVRHTGQVDFSVDDTRRREE